MTYDDVWREIFISTAKGNRARRLHEIIESWPLTSGEINDLVDEVWTNQEFPSQCRDEWISIWNNYSITAGKQRLIDRLFREPRIIYRGGTADGFSWTFNRQKAVWFATYRKFDRDYQLNERLTWAHEVKMIYNDRHEQEVVLNPEIFELEAAV